MDNPMHKLLWYCHPLSSLQGTAQAPGCICSFTEAQSSPLPSASHQQPNLVPRVCPVCYKMWEDSSPQLPHLLFICAFCFVLFLIVSLNIRLKGSNVAVRILGLFPTTGISLKGLSTKFEVLQDLDMQFISVPFVT